jgi:hypothetical protein
MVIEKSCKVSVERSNVVEGYGGTVFLEFNKSDRLPLSSDADLTVYADLLTGFTMSDFLLT